MKKLTIFLCLLTSVSFLYTQQYTFDTLVTYLNEPTAFAFLPNGNIIVNQKRDSTKIYTLNNQLVSCFWNFNDSLVIINELGLLGICVDPNYTVNRYIYCYYTHNIPRSIRVVRLTENNNLGTNPVILFNVPMGGGVAAHVGGNIHFGRDGKLYISIGDNGTGSDAQLLNNFRGKILRINSNGTIPNDNPFYDDGNPLTGNDDRIWALGLRNSFDFTFSPFNDSLYATENGQTGNDEVNFIRKGKNYGWPVCQGYCVPYNPLYRQPMITIQGSLPSQGYAPTGIVIYNGSQMPELNGRLLIGGAGNTTYAGITKCELANAPFNDTISSSSIITPLHYVTSIVQGTDGYIYIAYMGFLPYNGKIFRMRHSTLGINNPSLPVKYSLEQNYPNPFNPVTMIKYSLPKQSFVTLQIFDMLGQEIKVLVNENKQAGNYEVEWNADAFPSGVYFYRLTADEYTEQKKMVLIK